MIIITQLIPLWGLLPQRRQVCPRTPQWIYIYDLVTGIEITYILLIIRFLNENSIKNNTKIVKDSKYYSTYTTLRVTSSAKASLPVDTSMDLHLRLGIGMEITYIFLIIRFLNERAIKNNTKIVKDDNYYSTYTTLRVTSSAKASLRTDTSMDLHLRLGNRNGDNLYTYNYSILEWKLNKK